jgi:2-haloacid dehalogenase
MERTMRLTEFSALTFDCYGTLIDWETGILEALRPWTAAHGVEVDDEELLAAFGRAESRREAAEPTAPYPRILAGVLEDLAAELGTTASPEETAAFADSVKDWPAFPDSPGALAYLKRHYRLVIVSNVDRASFRHSNARLGVTFDAIVTADDAAAYKPAPNHFHLALAQLAEMGVAQDQVLHVAQSLYHDHVPAKRLGLRTMWVNRHAARTQGADAAPDGAPGTTPAGPGGSSSGAGPSPSGGGGSSSGGSFPGGGPSSSGGSFPGGGATPGGAGPSAGGGATPAPSEPVTPDGEVPTLAALADLHRRETGDAG